MTDETYLCKRCGVTWIEVPGHPKSYCDSMFYPAEVKRLQLQIDVAVQGSAMLIRERDDALRLNGELLKRVEEFKCSAKAEECTARHFGYNLAIDDVLEILREPLRPNRVGDGHLCIAAEDVPCSICGRVAEKRKCLCGPEGQCDYHAVTRIDVPINQQCWCAAKAEAKDAKCPVHD